MAKIGYSIQKVVAKVKDTVLIWLVVREPLSYTLYVHATLLTPMTAFDVFESCESTLRSKMMATWASMGLKVVLSSGRRDPDAWSRQ